MTKKMTKRRRKERSRRDSLFLVTITGHLVPVGVHSIQDGQVEDGERHFGTNLKRQQVHACPSEKHVYLLTYNHYSLESSRNRYYCKNQSNVNKEIYKNLAILRNLSSNFRSNKSHCHFL